MSLAVGMSSYKQTAVIIGLRLASVIVGLGFVKYYTNTLSIEQIAEFFYVGTLSYLLNAIVFVPVDSYMQARIAGLETIPWRGIIKLYCMSLYAALVLSALVSVPLYFYDLLAVGQIPLLYAMAAMLYLCSSLRNLLNIRGHASFSAGMIFMESCSRLAVFVLFTALMGASVTALLLSSVLALVPEAFVLINYARKVLQWSSDKGPLDQTKTIVRTSSSMTGGALSSLIHLQGYRILYPAAGCPNTSAVLAVVSNIGAVGMASCSAVLSQLLLPKVYNTNGRAIRWYTMWVAAISLLILIFSLAFSGMLVEEISSVEYLPFAPAIFMGVVVESGNLFIGGFSAYLLLHNLSGILLRAQLAGAVLSIAGCLALIAHSPSDPILLAYVISGAQIVVVLTLLLYVLWHSKRAS